MSGIANDVARVLSGHSVGSEAISNDGVLTALHPIVETCTFELITSCASALGV